MNPFFDISDDENLPYEELPLRNLGKQQIFAIVGGRRGSDYWGTSGSASKTTYTNTTTEHYDRQFVYKLQKWKPVYKIDGLIEHHFHHYTIKNKQDGDEFLKHMRYVILPILKKHRNTEVCTELFEQWLDNKEAQHIAQLKPTVDQSPKPGTINKTVHRIHFDDLSWSDFERLIFAFVKRLRTWETIDWLGQSGHDEGQDIWGESQGKTYCYLCANYQALTLKKASDDIDKLVKAKAIPDYLIAVCGGKVAAGVNKNIKSYAQGIGISNVEVWSGADIEENMRLEAPVLLQRFFEGNSFPENGAVMTDIQIVKELTDCFDRPAFKTPFYREVNIPDFGKAITDTIEVLNTGIHRLRDGTLIKQIPSRHQLKHAGLKAKVADLYELVVKLRDTLVDLSRKNEIENCGCGDSDCPVYMLSDNACRKMDHIRQEIFDAIRNIQPGSPKKKGCDI